MVIGDTMRSYMQARGHLLRHKASGLRSFGLPSLVRGVAKVVRSGFRAIVTESRFQILLREKARKESWRTWGLGNTGRYIVSTEKGIYLLAKEGWRRVSRVPAFGIALADDDIYLASWQGLSTMVLKGRRDALTKPGMRFGWENIYETPTIDDAGRIHQIATLGDSLWIANTAKNTYTKIDRHTGRWQANLCPFRCSFGHAINSDHNHVNSVYPKPGFLLFTAFKANRESVFGLAGNGLIRLYMWRNMGAHDCIFRGADFIFSDSYRFWDKQKGGGVVLNGSPLFAEYFDANPCYFVRGLAGSGEEMIIGNSFHGDRETRFQGTGMLLRALGSSIVSHADMDAAQIYDILCEDGRHFDKPCSISTFEEASKILEIALGAPVEEFPLRDAMLGVRGKKFSEDDLGEIEEYL